MADHNGNSACLQGLQCPKCGEHEHIRIHGNSTFAIRDAGAESHEAVYWGDESLAGCTDGCKFEGKIKDFKKGYEEAWEQA